MNLERRGNKKMHSGIAMFWDHKALDQLGHRPLAHPFDHPGST